MIILCTAAPRAPPVKKNVVNDNAAPDVKKNICMVGFVSQFFPTGYTRLLTDISALIH